MTLTPDIGTSTDQSNIVNIHDAVYDIALNHSGISWANSKQWDLPTTEEWMAKANAWPFLSVTWPTFVEYSVGVVSVGDFMSRSIETQFTWDIDVWCLMPYGTGNPEVFSTPTGIATKLIQAFTLYSNLNGTCDEMNVGKPQLVKVFAKSPNGGLVSGPPLYFASILTLRCIEMIETDYTNIA